MSDKLSNKPNKNQLADDESIQALKILIKEISKKHDKPYHEVIDAIREEKIEETTEKDTTKQQNKNISTKDQIPEYNIPADIFSHDAGYLELIVGYSKDQLGIPFSKIATILNRDQRTIWSSYNNLKKKHPEIITAKKISSPTFIPLAVFSDRKYSTFENLLLHLSADHQMKAIAEILGKDYKTIWTVLTRARRKEK